MGWFGLLVGIAVWADGGGGMGGWEGWVYSGC